MLMPMYKLQADFYSPCSLTEAQLIDRLPGILGLSLDTFAIGTQRQHFIYRYPCTWLWLGL